MAVLNITVAIPTGTTNGYGVADSLDHIAERIRNDYGHQESLDQHGGLSGAAFIGDERVGYWVITPEQTWDPDKGWSNAPADVVPPFPDMTDHLEV
jgi:hypothetical protein